MPSRQSGVWPTHRAGGLRIRLHGLHGRSMRTARWSAGRAARTGRIGRPEHRHDGRAHGGGEVHRARVAGHEQRAAFKHARRA